MQLSVAINFAQDENAIFEIPTTSTSKIVLMGILNVNISELLTFVD